MTDTYRTMEIKGWPEYKEVNELIASKGFAISIELGPKKYIERKNNDVKWGLIEGLPECSLGIPDDVIPLLQVLANRVRLESNGEMDIRGNGVEMYPGEWEQSERGLGVDVPEFKPSTVPTVRCPHCSANLVKDDPATVQQWEGIGTVQWCMACGETFVVKADGDTTFLPGNMLIDDFRTVETVQDKLDRRGEQLFRNSGLGEDEPPKNSL
jgi:hypothetical protein